LIVVRNFALLAAVVIVVSPATVVAQDLTNGHRGVCSDCHVAAGGNNRYELSQADSTLVFSVDNFGFSKVIGTFSNIGGGFVFDSESVETTSVLASVEVASLDTSDAALDALLLSERFLDAANHPAITFQSESVAQIDEHHFRVDGALSIRGISQIVSLDVALNRHEAHPVTGRQTAGLEISGQFDRSEFGLTLGLPSIGDVVEFTVYAQGSLFN
jgi:polyisoprenoid-binding protein YceI